VADELPELAPLTLAVRHLLSASQEFTARTSRELGVNGTDMAALALLAQHGPMGPAELASSLGIRSASVTVLIDRLERAGHVQRVRSERDRRRVSVTTTPSAYAASLAAVLPTILAIDEVSRGLDDHDRAVVARFLDAVTRVVHGRPAEEPRGA
jgi:DNA-binding MarR family transcriptional regulator